MEKFQIRFLKENKTEITKIIQLFALQFEPPFANRLQYKLKKFINNKGKEYVVQIHHSSRNSTVIAIENLHPIGSYAIVTTVDTFWALALGSVKNHKLRSTC
jgi:hypothetical protein